jgi:hypothetical protein
MQNEAMSKFQNTATIQLVCIRIAELKPIASVKLWCPSRSNTHGSDEVPFERPNVAGYHHFQIFEFAVGIAIEESLDTTTDVVLANIAFAKCDGADRRVVDAVLGEEGTLFENNADRAEKPTVDNARCVRAHPRNATAKPTVRRVVICASRPGAATTQHPNQLKR